MKKTYLIIILIGLVLMISGCGNGVAEERPELKIENIEFDDISNSDSSMLIVEQYSSFEELLIDESINTQFVFGKVKEIGEYSWVCDYAEFQVYDSTGKTEKSIVVTFCTDEHNLILDNEYVLHLNYVSEHDYYHLTSSYLSKYTLIGDKFISHEANIHFNDEELIKETFLDYIFTK